MSTSRDRMSLNVVHFLLLQCYSFTRLTLYHMVCLGILVWHKHINAAQFNVLSYTWSWGNGCTYVWVWVSVELELAFRLDCLALYCLDSAQPVELPW